MGMGAARSLVAAGVETWGQMFEPNPSRISWRMGEGAASPAALASKVDALLILVVNAAQTESVLFGETGAVTHMKKGAVVVASSTVLAPTRMSLRAGWPSTVCLWSMHRSAAVPVRRQAVR